MQGRLREQESKLTLIPSLRKQLSERQSRISALECKVRDGNVAISRKDRTLAELRKQIVELQSQSWYKAAECPSCRLHETQIAQLRQELEDERAVARHAKESLVSVEAKLQEAEQECSKLRTTVKNMNQASSNATSECNTLRSQLAALEQMLQLSRAECAEQVKKLSALERTPADERAAAEAQMTTLQKDNADTQVLLKSHEAQIVILKADTAALKLKATTLSTTEANFSVPSISSPMI